MKIASVVLTHNNVRLTTDTVQSIETWVGDHVLVVVDEVGWSKFQNAKISKAKVVKGFLHAHNRSPYRNYALGLKTLYETWPDCDWYLYSECDCLFTSNKFQADLAKAASKNAWCVGFDLRQYKFGFPLLEKILAQGPINQSYYLLGCCQFHHHVFVDKLYKLGFFERFLEETKSFEKGYFPDYTRWAFEEELWPTLAAHLGGKVYELCCWKGGEGRKHQDIKEDPHMLYAGSEHDQWRGHYKVYPVRNAPELAPEEVRPETSIAHPIKTALDPIRRLQRKKLLTFF
jgi:hypothetical protein